MVDVKVLEIDRQNRIKLSIKALLEPPVAEEKKEEAPAAEALVAPAADAAEAAPVVEEAAAAAPAVEEAAPAEESKPVTVVDIAAQVDSVAQADPEPEFDGAIAAGADSMKNVVSVEATEPAAEPEQEKKED